MSDVTNIVIEVKAGDDWQRMVFEGREAWALARLIEGGDKGVTPLQRPAPRWSAYVFKLRQAGLAIETVHEAHYGPFAGHHGRYILRTPVRVLREVAA